MIVEEELGKCLVWLVRLQPPERAPTKELIKLASCTENETRQSDLRFWRLEKTLVEATLICDSTDSCRHDVALILRTSIWYHYTAPSRRVRSA